MKCVNFCTLFLVGALSAGAVYAGSVNIGGPWYEFGFGAATSTVFACPTCTPSSGGDSQFASAPSYTFTASGGGGVITIQDAFLRGDQFAISIDGGPFMDTSIPVNDGTQTCGGDGTDPAVCALDSTYSNGTFDVAAGAHTFTIEVIQDALGGPTGGAAYFRLDPLISGTPEPVSFVLVGAGLALVALRRRGLRS